MKTTTTLMLAAMLGLSVMNANADEGKPGWFRRTFGVLTWIEIQTVAKTPRSICAAVHQHVSYKEDLGDEWATGMATWNRGSGDCEDFAACVLDLCKAAGIKATTRIFFPKDSWEAHAVVIGSWKGQLWISSNGGYEAVKSMDDAKRIIAKDLGWQHKEILTATPEEMKSGSIASTDAGRRAGLQDSRRGRVRH